MNAIDQLPNGDDPRTDPRLNDVAYIATDEGQALLAAAQEATRQDRLASKRASEKARRERIKSNRAWLDEQAERAPGVAQAEEEARRASAAAKQAQVDEALAEADDVLRVGEAVLATIPANKPLKLGAKAIVLDGEEVYPILHRDGSIALHQTDNYIWKCPTCSRRLRAATCEGVAHPHSSVPAPTGYRFADRKVGAGLGIVK